MKIMIKYARDGAANYISHLDMQRTFARAIRRADIDAEYSQGFNPHIVMSFASPLSVGYATEADYLEVGVVDGSDVEKIKDALNAVLTDDIRVVDVVDLGENKKKLMALNDSASYRIVFLIENAVDCDRIKCAVEKISGSVAFVTLDRRGKEIDIIPLVRALHAEQNIVCAELMNASSGALNPAVVAHAVRKEAGIEAGYKICRLECYAKMDGKILPMGELIK